jgi:hypothetical protein
VIAAVVAWRARESERERDFELGPPTLAEPGREATLS